jgi:hypothetical protein
MKSNRTHTPPPRVENLGENTFYYNFNVVKYRPKDEDGNDMTYWGWDYDQVKVSYPITIGDIKRELNAKGHQHEVNSDEILIEADVNKVQSPEKSIDYTNSLPTNASEQARNNLKDKNWKLNG